MIDLDSPEWNSIASSASGTGALVVRLLREATAGDDNAYPELYHQLCHQFTVAAAAYLAAPHLVRIACEASPQRRVWPLSIVGAIVAARATYPASAAPLREEWRDEHIASTREALRLSAELLQHPGLLPSETQELIATVSALHGLTDLAMHLFLQGGVTELSCPVCGEVIQFAEEAESKDIK